MKTTIKQQPKGKNRIPAEIAQVPARSGQKCLTLEERADPSWRIYAVRYWWTDYKGKRQDWATCITGPSREQALKDFLTLNPGLDGAEIPED